MPAPLESNVILSLSRIDELFNAPAANPFSTREVEILGEAGLDLVQKQVMRQWPRRPASLCLTIQLPADQVTPGLAQQTREAVDRYCADRIDSNRLQRKQVARVSRFQLGMAACVVVFDVFALYFLLINPIFPVALIPPFLRGVLAVLALYAGSVVIFDSLYSLIFDWIPYVRDNSTYRMLRTIDVVIMPQQVP